MNLEQMIKNALDREYRDDHLSKEERERVVSAYRKENFWLKLSPDVELAYQEILEREG